MFRESIIHLLHLAWITQLQKLSITIILRIISSIMKCIQNSMRIANNSSLMIQFCQRVWIKINMQETWTWKTDIYMNGAYFYAKSLIACLSSVWRITVIYYYRLHNARHCLNIVFSRTWTTTAQTTQFAYSYSSLLCAPKFALFLRYLIRHRYLSSFYLLKLSVQLLVSNWQKFMLVEIKV